LIQASTGTLPSMSRPRQPPPVVERVPGGYVLHLDSAHREVLISVLGQLRDMITTGEGGAALRRLHPPAYHLDHDSDAEAEYQRLMAEELVGSRLAALQVVADALASPPTTVLDESAITSWLQSVNSLRLVLGTILDVQEDDDSDDLDENHPSMGQVRLYEFLGFLLDATVRALSDELPDR
jgi:hypothetical protein